MHRDKEEEKLEALKTIVNELWELKEFAVSVFLHFNRNCTVQTRDDGIYIVEEPNQPENDDHASLS